MYTKWRKEHRKVLGLPSNRYYELLQFIEDNIQLEYINKCRYVSFFQTIVSSKNKIISYIARNKIFDCK